MDVVLGASTPPRRLAPASPCSWAASCSTASPQGCTSAPDGPGPRDGLTTGLAARGHSIRVVPTAIEVTVLVAGFALGGTVGIGTLLYALAIGPISHVTIPAMAVRARVSNLT